MKKIFILITTISLTINALALDIWDGSSSPWTNGSGTENDPYLIETAANLAYLAEKVNEGYQAQGQEVFHDTYFMMTDDLDLNDINWTPIGTVDMSMQGYYFGGVFDGWYHNIDHMKITSSADVCGLFAGVGNKAVIKHLSVTNGDINSTGTGVGGIVGAAYGNSRVHQCAFSGTITVTNNGSFCGAGGITSAAAENSFISECSFSGSITATNNGGFTGAAGAGGIVGIAMDNALISSCYNTGSITASSFMLNVAAGIVAVTMQENEVFVERCYNVGTLNGATKGGIFGMISPINPFKDEASITVIGCYYLDTCGGTTNYGTSMTSSQMQSSSFVNMLNEEAPITYVMDNGSNNGYPILALYAIRIHEASDITAHSVKLSADIHSGNITFSRVCFEISDMDMTFFKTVDVDTDGYVETIVEDLADDTSYQYCMSVYHDGSIFLVSNTFYFTTEFDGVDELQNTNISIYPNPTSDFIHIDCKDVPWRVSIPINIYTLDGNLIKTVEDTNIVDVRDLNEGVYLINIGGVIKKFIVETP